MCLCPKTSFAPTFAPVLVFCKPFAGQSPAGTPSLMLPFSGRPPADGRRMGGEIIGAGYPGLPSRCSVALGYPYFAPMGLGERRYRASRRHGPPFDITTDPL